jgi:hypothetical protein
VFVPVGEGDGLVGDMGLGTRTRGPFRSNLWSWRSHKGRKDSGERWPNRREGRSQEMDGVASRVEKDELGVGLSFGSGRDKKGQGAAGRDTSRGVGGATRKEFGICAPRIGYWTDTTQRSNITEK